MEDDAAPLPLKPPEGGLRDVEATKKGRRKPFDALKLTAWEKRWFQAMA